MHRVIAPFALALVTAVSACGGDAFELDEDVVGESQDEATSAGTWYAIRRDTRRCSAPACGGFFVRSIGKATTSCPGATATAECYVATADLANAGTDALEPGTSAGRTTVVRGRLARTTIAGRPFVRLNVNEVWVSPSTTTPAGTWYFVTGRDARRQALKVGTSSTRVLSTLDLAPARASAEDFGRAYTASNTSEGLLVVGAIATQGSGSRSVNTLAASKFFLRQKRVAPPATGALCGAPLRADLARATADLLYMSESDYPFEIFERTGAGPLDTAAFLRAAGLPANTPVETRTVDQFFSWIAREEAGMDPEEAATTARFRELRRTLGQHLTNLRVFRTGEIEVKVWILGNTACGDLAGVTTISIET